MLTAANETEEYDSDGKLISITALSGKKLVLSYNNFGVLQTVTDTTTLRTLTFTPASNDLNAIASITDSSGFTVSYQQTAAGELMSVTYGAGTQNVRVFHYEDAGNASLLTGITDERGLRVSTYNYDVYARVLSTRSWAAPGVAANQHSYAYPNASTIAITNPLGLTQSVTHALIANVDRITASTQPCPSCGISPKTASYDSNGYPDTQTDFNNNLTDFDHDVRGLEIRRVEAKNTPQARIVETEWSATFRVPTERRVCAANALNTCPSTAVTPNLLSKSVMTYNARVGNITGVNQTVAGTLTPFGLTYDKLYRLTAVNIINTPTAPLTPPTPIEGFTYDATGNRLSKTLGTGPLVDYNYVPFTHKLANAGTGAQL